MEEKVEGLEVVNVALNGFSEAWNLFIREVLARDKLPTFNRHTRGNQVTLKW